MKTRDQLREKAIDSAAFALPITCEAIERNHFIGGYIAGYRAAEAQEPMSKFEQAIASVVEPKYRIKPLEWGIEEGTNRWRAMTIFGCYEAQDFYNPGHKDIRWRLHKQPNQWMGCSEFIDEAKAACEKHYEERIKKCLIEVR